MEVRASEDEKLFTNSEENYRSIIYSVDEGFCIYEMIYGEDEKPVDLKWIEVNPAYEKQTGLKNVVGKLYSELFFDIEDYWLEVYDKVIKTGAPIHFENWHKPTGRWYNTFASRVDGPGSRRIAILFSDVTERK